MTTHDENMPEQNMPEDENIEENETNSAQVVDEPVTSEHAEDSVSEELPDEGSDVDVAETPKAQIPVEAETEAEPDSDSTSKFPPGHLDVASKVREPNEQEKIVGSILDEFEKIDEVAGETGFKLESAIAKEEILQGDDADEQPSTEDVAPDKPVWKTEAEQRYEAQQARKQRMLEERRKLDEERRQKQQAYKARLKADREAYEAELLQKKADEKARLIAEREAADARLRAEREAKRRAREQYEAQQSGHVIDDNYSPETIEDTESPDVEAPAVGIPEQQPTPPAKPPQGESPQAKPPSAREREAVNRLGKPPSDDESDDESE
ncbi:MAG: hypothetical protein CL607_12895 [Anaerolineaceae bacterium]|nr:hypothetical protein [Anaerolineaceae bacterium]